MGDDPNQRGNSRRWIMRAVEDSLRRLGTDYIDLHQVHRPSPDTGIQETLSVFVCEQAPYSMLVRGIEADVLPTAARHGMGVITYSPLAGGWLSGRRRQDADLPTPAPARQRLADRFDMSLPVNQHKPAATEALAHLAEDAGMTLMEMAIAFALNHPAVTSALIGPRTLQHLQTQLPAADVVLDPEVLGRTDEIVAPGTVINPADSSFANPAREPAARRR